MAGMAAPYQSAEIWAVDFQEKLLKLLSDLKAKMHQNRFWLGLHPIPRWGSLQRSRGPTAGFKGPTSKRKARVQGRGGARMGKGKKGVKGRKGAREKKEKRERREKAYNSQFYLLCSLLRHHEQGPTLVAEFIK